ncbi:MAG: hypothetical protein DMF78_18990 [Acidobacteria bacterium]|nr:MAG: hypothetical protein DMF78_18990 [Acidobacteriota bacterium]
MAVDAEQATRVVEVVVGDGSEAGHERNFLRSVHDSRLDLAHLGKRPPRSPHLRWGPLDAGLCWGMPPAGEVRFELRPATAADRDRLYALHRAAMRDVVDRTWGWDEPWQHAHFNARFDPAAFSLIVAGGREVGALCVQERAGELYVAAVEVAPEEQGRGLGTAVLRDVIARAATIGAAVTLQVLKANVRAQRLYERLGFYATGEVDVHVRMRHDAGAAPTHP